MSDKVITSKVSDEEYEFARLLADERQMTLSALIRSLLMEQRDRRKGNWNDPCFGGEPITGDPDPRYDGKSIDEVVYGL